MKLSNLSGVEAWSAGGPPPPGKYLVRVDDASEGSSSGGHPQLELSMTVVDAGGYAGAEIRDWLVVTPNSLGKVVALLRAVSVEIPPGEFELDPGSLVGKTCEVVLREEPSYKDPAKTVTRVAGYRPVSGQAAMAGVGAAAKSDEDLPF